MTTPVDDLAEPDRRYPVVVEETRRYVLWIDARTQDEAVELYDGEPYDPNRCDMFWYDWAVGEPDDLDWDRIEAGAEYWPGTRADAHVDAWHDERRRRQVETIQPPSACVL